MGALSTLRAATDPGVIGGQYYGPSGPGQTRGYPRPVTSSTQSYDKNHPATPLGSLHGTHRSYLPGLTPQNQRRSDRRGSPDCITAEDDTQLPLKSGALPPGGQERGLGQRNASA